MGLYNSNIIVTMHSFSCLLRLILSCMLLTRICLLLQVGHLHAGYSKEVTVTFSSNQPVTLRNQPMRCKVCQVEFQQPLEEVADWDDRQRTVQWLSGSPHAEKNKVHMLKKDFDERESAIAVERP